VSKKFNFVATGVGTMPFTEPAAACTLIFQNVPEAPHWPQLLKASSSEGMIDQFLEGAPGVVEEGEKAYLRALEPYQEWEQFYADYEGNNLDAFAVSAERAQGLQPFLEEIGQRAPLPFVKGQVTGPITLGLTLKEQGGAVAFFNQDLRDMLVKLVAMKARWQEETFRRIVPKAETIIFLDEPILSSYGSAFMNVSREDVITALKETCAPLQGLKGVHICGNTDWPMIMEADLDIINFDAYYYLSSFLLYAEQLRGFLEGGGAIAWGIVPTDDEELKNIQPPELVGKLKEGMDQLAAEGIPHGLLVERALITPSCGAGSLSEEGAWRAYEMTAEVTALLRRDYAS
jgi:methionine synthase II (cobalamin-independent)